MISAEERAIVFLVICIAVMVFGRWLSNKMDDMGW